ncbi:hypothetical protein D3C71_1896220 [compost metagenome]
MSAAVPHRAATGKWRWFPKAVQMVVFALTGAHPAPKLSARMTYKPPAQAGGFFVVRALPEGGVETGGCAGPTATKTSRPTRA